MTKARADGHEPTKYRASVVSETAVDTPVRGSGYRAGDVIGGKYRLDRLLGMGGMGAVWTAANQVLDVEVCVKLIRDSAGESEGRDRLLREARAAARLTDPSIVRVFDFGHTDLGDPYIVMERLHGEDLRARLDRESRLSPTEAVELLLPIVQAMVTAHEAGVVHRDIKPDNVFIATTVNGKLQPKLLDFGIARSSVGRELRLTQTGSLVGSPAYMSPEQASGQELDHRCDIWACVVVLYEVIAGKVPFHAENYNAMMQAILHQDPESFMDLGINEPALWEIIEKGLNRDAQLRWQTSKEFGVVLAQWLVSRGVAADVMGLALRETWLRPEKRSIDDGEQRGEVKTKESSNTLVSAVMRSSGQRLRQRERRSVWLTTVAAGIGVVVVLFWVLQHESGEVDVTPSPAGNWSEPTSVRPSDAMRGGRRHPEAETVVQTASDAKPQVRSQPPEASPAEGTKPTSSGPRIASTEAAVRKAAGPRISLTQPSASSLPSETVPEASALGKHMGAGTSEPFKNPFE